MRQLILMIMLVLLPLAGVAEDKEFVTHGDYKIFHSAFNSSFINPNIAAINNIVRGKGKGLVNIAVVHKSGTGKAAVVSGYVSNIFQQSQPLKFVQVTEQNAIYYLAPFEFENEDYLTFKIDVAVSADQPAKQIKFQKTMYHD